MRCFMKTSVWSYFLMKKEEMTPWEKYQLHVLGHVPYCSVLPSLPSGISGRLRSNISEFAVP